MEYPHDTRLDKLKIGQYRLWHDAQNILVPVGQSTTKPLTKEIVNANVRVYGDIDKGYFHAPVVDFTNSNVDIERFDRFYLSTFRDEMPTTPDIDLETMSIYAVDVYFELELTWYTYFWSIPKRIFMYRSGVNQYASETAYHFTTYTPYTAQGDLEFNIELFAYFNIDIPETHELGDFPFGGHKLHMGLQQCVINRGSSEYLYNPKFNPNIPEITFAANNITVVRGLS